MSDRVVLLGSIARVSMDLSITAGDALVTPPVTLESPGAAQQEAFDDLRARLSSKVRIAFDCSDVLVAQPAFTDRAEGSAKAIVCVSTQGTAKIAAAGFSNGITTLPGALGESVCSYVSELIGGSPPPTVAVTDSDVELGEGALTATVEEGGADGADALSSGEKKAARWITGLMLIPIAAFVLLVLNVNPCDLFSVVSPAKMRGL